MLNSEQKLNDNESGIYFSSFDTLESIRNKNKNVISKNLPGVYDLGGLNVSGTYDLSNNTEFERSDSKKTITGNLEEDRMLWLTNVRKNFIIIGALFVCIVLGVGMSVYVTLGRGNMTNGTLLDEFGMHIGK